jgi:hypothetical protein
MTNTAGSDAPTFPCQVRGANVRFGSYADICTATSHVRFTPNNDRKSGHAAKAMSALPPKADMCDATSDVCYGPIADIRVLASHPTKPQGHCTGFFWREAERYSGLLGRPTLRVLFEHFAVDHLIVDRVEFVVGSIEDRAGLKLASMSHGHSVAGGIDRPGLAAKATRAAIRLDHISYGSYVTRAQVGIIRLGERHRRDSKRETRA